MHNIWMVKKIIFHFVFHMRKLDSAVRGMVLYMTPYWSHLQCYIHFFQEDMQMKGRKQTPEKWIGVLSVRIIFHALKPECVSNRFGRGCLQGCHKGRHEACQSKNKPKQMSWVQSWLCSQQCFMIEQLTCSLSWHACVRTNKEADCGCPQWFILPLCPPFAPDENLIKPCLVSSFHPRQQEQIISHHLQPLLFLYEQS